MTDIPKDSTTEIAADASQVPEYQGLQPADKALIERMANEAVIRAQAIDLPLASPARPACAAFCDEKRGSPCRTQCEERAAAEAAEQQQKPDA